MKVLLIGSGGREHAIAWKLSKSPLLSELYCAPGNPGTAAIATNIDLAAMSSGALAVWAVEHQIDLTIVGPEDPLGAGIVDVFEERGLRIFGPTKKAAQLETSKAFSKRVMQKAGVRTAPGEVFDDFEAAKSYVLRRGAPMVVKADGLCKGKGVIVAESEDETLAALERMMVKKEFGEGGARVVLEERLSGQEATIMALVDGRTVLPLAVSQDYKRVGDNNTGPNTGGMGAISPTPVLAEKRLQNLVGEIFLPVVGELLAQGIPYRGFLYAGVMVDSDGTVNVIEFNARLGDPETQVVLMRLESDLLHAIDAATKGELPFVDLRWRSEAAACVVMAAKGYPGTPESGDAINGLFSPEDDLVVFHAGTAREKSETVVTNGGRVLAVTALGSTLSKAVARAYEGVEKISFSGMQFRRDIGGGVW